MINTSTEYKKMLEKERNFTAKATCILKDGTKLDLNGDNFFSGGVTISDGVSSSNQFDIGSAIINQLTLVIDNTNESFSDYNFTDAVITVWVGMQLSGRIEWLKKGVFNSSDPTTTPAVLTLKALDNMAKFDRAYDGRLTFPTTLQAIVQHCCTQCGVLLYNGQFPNYSYIIQKNPFDDEKSNVTYRALISYCALLSGCYARCNADGRLEFKWYNTAAFDGIIDGGIFDRTTEPSYQTGNNLDGGNFTDYNSGDNVDGGTFTEYLPYHHIYSFSSLSVSTEDVVITGIRVKAADSADSAGNKVEGETYLCGAEGYILQVSGNPLIEAGKAKAVAEYLANRIVGMRFRPFNASCIGDPSIEAGDAAVIIDRKGNSYNTYLTNITYSTGNYASISCDAEPAARHSADRYSQIEQIVADIKKDSQRQLSSYAKYVDQMNQLAINAMGYYETSETQSDGSTINYMHDKAVLSQSTIVYKKTIDGFFISRDGGKTYVGGMDKDANIVANVIAAIGISFDWAKGGTLTLGGDNNTNGILVIKNASGKNCGIIDNNGVELFSLNNEKSTLLTGGDLRFKDEGKLKGYLSPKSFGGNENGMTAYTDSGVFTIAYNVMSDNSNTVVYGKAMSVYSYGAMLRAGISTQAQFSTGVTFDSSNIYFSGFYVGAGSNKTATKIQASSTGTLTLTGNLSVSGTKNRVVDTESYSERLLYCYEMPSPMFGDIGEGTLDEKGECCIAVDDMFMETIAVGTEYQVFLQKEGAGDLWVADKKMGYFVVKGTPDLNFAWEIKAKQRGFGCERLESANIDILADSEEMDYEADYLKEIDQLISEQEELLYETA